MAGKYWTKSRYTSYTRHTINMNSSLDIVMRLQGTTHTSYHSLSSFAFRWDEKVLRKPLSIFHVDVVRPYHSIWTLMFSMSKAQSSLPRSFSFPNMTGSYIACCCLLPISPAWPHATSPSCSLLLPLPSDWSPRVHWREMCHIQQY